MDPKPQTVFTIDPISDDGSNKAKKKSGGGAVKIFKVALLMLRRRSKKSKASVDMGSNKGLWRRLLGSMRPLHIQGNELIPANMSSPTLKPKEDFEELPMPLPLPSASVVSVSSSSFSPTMRSSSFCTSQYASATNLQELDGNSYDNDHEDEDAIRDDNGGDEMIDAKAEEFIAQFYEQMRRQRHNKY